MCVKNFDNSTSDVREAISAESPELAYVNASRGIALM
jgi:hypothetical protein